MNDFIRGHGFSFIHPAIQKQIHQDPRLRLFRDPQSPGRLFGGDQFFHQ